MAQRIMNNTPLGRLWVGNPGERRVISLVDKKRPDLVVYGWFDHQYDQSDTGDVSRLFDASYETLSKSPEDKVFTFGELPIISLVGKARAPVVIKHWDGSCDIIDGASDTPSSFVGLG